MKPIKKISCFLLLCLVLCPLSGQAAEPVVRMDGDRLTLQVKDNSLSEILGMLSDQGIRIRIDPRINPKITAAFKDRPIGTAMTSILRSVDYALIWRKEKASTADEPRLWEIRIFYKGQEALAQPLKKGVNLTVVNNGDGTYHVQDILLLRLAPTVTEAALAALLDQLGASIVDAYAPLGIVRLRLPHGSDVPAITETIANYPGGSNRRTGLCLSPGRRPSGNGRDERILSPAFAAAVIRRDPGSGYGQRPAFRL